MRRLSCLLWFVACSPGAGEEPAVPNPTRDAPKTTSPQPTASATSSDTSTATATHPTATQEQAVVTLFVHEQRVDCHGEAPRKCLQVRRDPADEWTYFYDTIEGFEYEESYRYELRVEVSTDKNPPADKSSFSYRLIEVVSKEKVEAATP